MPDKGLDYVERLRDLMPFLARIVQKNADQSGRVDAWCRDAEGLVTKYFNHAASIVFLSRGTTLTDFILESEDSKHPIAFTDTASIPVLARAALETYLTFYHIFASAACADEREFRRLLWRIPSLYRRIQQLRDIIGWSGPNRSAEHQRQLEDEKQIIRDDELTLERNTRFVGLPDDGIRHRLLRKLRKGDSDIWRSSLTNNGKFSTISWRDLGENAGLNPFHAAEFYRYLCGYAHSGYLSMLQVYQAVTPEDQRSLIQADLGFLIFLTANVINAYCEVFPLAKEAAAAEPTMMRVTQEWSGLSEKNPFTGEP